MNPIGHEITNGGSALNLSQLRTISADAKAFSQLVGGSNQANSDSLAKAGASSASIFQPQTQFATKGDGTRPFGTTPRDSFDDYNGQSFRVDNPPGTTINQQIYGTGDDDRNLRSLYRNPSPELTGVDTAFTTVNHADAEQVGVVLPWVRDGVTTTNISELPDDTGIVQTTCAQCAVGITIGGDGQVQLHHLNALPETENEGERLAQTDANYAELMEQIGGDGQYSTWFNARRLEALAGNEGLEHPIDVNRPVHVTATGAGTTDVRVYATYTDTTGELRTVEIVMPTERGGDLQVRENSNFDPDNKDHYLRPPESDGKEDKPEGGGSGSGSNDEAGSSNSGTADELQSHLQTLKSHWDDLNGSDSIVSVEDLHKELDRDNPPELKEAIQFLVDRPELIDKLDVGAKGGKKDGKISTNDLDAIMKKDLETVLDDIDPFIPTDKNITSITLILDNLSAFTIGKKLFNLDDVERVANRSASSPELREAAQDVLDTPGFFDFFDTLSKGGEPDGYASHPDVKAAENLSMFRDEL